jgi:hypothetical protein
MRLAGPGLVDARKTRSPAPGGRAASKDREITSRSPIIAAAVEGRLIRPQAAKRVAGALLFPFRMPATMATAQSVPEWTLIAVPDRWLFRRFLGPVAVRKGLNHWGTVYNVSCRLSLLF